MGVKVLLSHFKQRWVVAHHFVPNVLRELSNN